MYFKKLKKGFISVFLSFVLCISSNHLNSASLTTSDIINNSFNTKCLDYCIVGFCLYVFCTYWSCEYDIEPLIEHNISDVVVTSYRDPGKSPWIETATYNNGSNEGGEGAINNDKNYNNVKYKYVDAIGNPFAYLTQSGNDSEVVPFRYSVALSSSSGLSSNIIRFTRSTSINPKLEKRILHYLKKGKKRRKGTRKNLIYQIEKKRLTTEFNKFMKIRQRKLSASRKADPRDTDNNGVISEGTPLDTSDLADFQQYLTNNTTTLNYETGGGTVDAEGGGADLTGAGDDETGAFDEDGNEIGDGIGDDPDGIGDNPDGVNDDTYTNTVNDNTTANTLTVAAIGYDLYGIYNNANSTSTGIGNSNSGNSSSGNSSSGNSSSGNSSSGNSNSGNSSSGNSNSGNSSSGNSNSGNSSSGNSSSGGSSGNSNYYCKSKAIGMMPYFLSETNETGWRYGMPDKINPAVIGALAMGSLSGAASLAGIGTIEIGYPPAYTWGNVYPRTGFLATQDDKKAGAVTAQRAIDIINKGLGQSYMYIPLDVNAVGLSTFIPSSTWNKDWWQPLYPIAKAECGHFGGSPIAGKDDDAGQYAWGYWRRYQCCKPGKGVLVGKFKFPTPICANP